MDTKQIRNSSDDHSNLPHENDAPFEKKGENLQLPISKLQN
jgi:hypothetical protein